MLDRHRPKEAVRFIIVLGHSVDFFFSIWFLRKKNGKRKEKDQEKLKYDLSFSVFEETQ